MWYIFVAVCLFSFNLACIIWFTLIIPRVYSFLTLSYFLSSPVNTRPVLNFRGLISITRSLIQLILLITPISLEGNGRTNWANGSFIGNKGEGQKIYCCSWSPKWFKLLLLFFPRFLMYFINSKLRSCKKSMTLSFSILLTLAKSSRPQRWCDIDSPRNLVRSIYWRLIGCFTMQKSLDYTSKLLATTKDELKQVQYNLNERDYIISEQRKAGLI